MEKINRNNYEIFFLDHLEGNLDSSLKEEFLSFLSKNSDLKKEMEEYQSITLDNGGERFENKNGLRKIYFDGEVTLNNFEQYSIAASEGDLNEQQKLKLHIFLQKNPALMRDFVLYNKTKLQAGNSILFFGKNNLRKKLTGRVLILKRISVAASLLIVIAVSFFIGTRDYNNHETVITGNIELPEKQQSAEQNITPEESKNATINQFATNYEWKVINNTQTETYNILSEAKIEEQRFKLEPVSIIQNVRIPVQRNDIALAQIQMGPDHNLSGGDDLGTTIRRGMNDIAMVMESGGIGGTGRLTIWDIADVGINGFGKITGANVRVDKIKDAEGNVIALAFKSGRLNFTKKVNN